MKKLVTATTPHGTFTRTTTRAYQFVALIELSAPNGESKVYANWSTSRSGAEKLLAQSSQAQYADGVGVNPLGVYPLEA